MSRRLRVRSLLLIDTSLLPLAFVAISDAELSFLGSVQLQIENSS
jgi:hypothetical protein